jgi:hypothetical protein
MIRTIVIAGLLSAPLLAQAPASPNDCEAKRQALQADVDRLRQQVTYLTESVAALSKQLGVSSPQPASAPAPPPPAGPALLKVSLKTKYSKGQSCAVSLDGNNAGSIDYPPLEGKERVMEYSSGYLNVPPGTHRLGIGCSQVESSRHSEVYTDQVFAPGTSYTWHVKINVWTKALQLEEFVKEP